MVEVVKVKIGTKEFEIESPLTFKQLRIIEPNMARVIQMRINKENSSPEFYDRLADVILGAVNKKTPDYTRSMLDDEPTTINELTEAFKTIAKAAGMWKEQAESTPGEAAAQAA